MKNSSSGRPSYSKNNPSLSGRYFTGLNLQQWKKIIKSVRAGTVQKEQLS